MNDAIVTYLLHSVPAVITGLVIGLVIGLVLVVTAGVQQYAKGREDGFELGREQGAADSCRRKLTFEAPGTPDIMLHAVRRHGHLGR